MMTAYAYAPQALLPIFFRIYFKPTNPDGGLMVSSVAQHELQESRRLRGAPQ